MHRTLMRVGLPTFCFALSLTLASATLAIAQSAQPTPAAPTQPTTPSATPSLTRESLAGTYDGGQMEVAARLVLKPDGHFLYELAYGALDESAEGTWQLLQDTVFLTTVPTAVPPQFVVESDTPEPKGGLWIKLSSGPVEQGARQRIYLVYGPNEEMDMTEIADDGSVPFPNNRRPTAIIPEIPVYPVMSKAIPLTGTGGHRLTLRFKPNDIGKADFRHQALTIQTGELIMPRRDLQLMLHFKRQP